MLSEYAIPSQNAPGASADGEVYFCTRNLDGLSVAIKFKTRLSADSSARFVRENSILYELNPHPGIIEPITKIQQGLHQGEKKEYYIMHKAEMNIDTWMSTQTSNDIVKRLDAFKKICEALKHAHENGYTHRDLHWNNILVNSTLEDQIKLIDFGRAYDFNSEINLSDEPAWGNLVMPPEVRIGSVDQPNESEYIKGDIFALGIIWKMLIEEGINPIHKMFVIINDIDNYMLSSVGVLTKQQYYNQTTLSQRNEIYKEWIENHAFKYHDYYKVPLVNIIYGDKLSDIASRLVCFEVENRFDSVDQILSELERL